MTTLQNKDLETLRDDFCCEYGQVFAEQVCGLPAQVEEATNPQNEIEVDIVTTLDYLHKIGLQEEYLL
ncbi:hypothetical protein GK047_07610 [Paenibacillus sp. SYP-B3998]|uniref:Uncharacterized protein n=1 Tax=Paenibacillus sp. SYP-B3998 TaxID=2678564 RepID=A0A6G3ZUY2_9BACL|nr:hypothetical protein [Paenibacillus sp. SYP-B3998]NEW05880.1 hypothetical protein [Paenibacillus sp. SYP-B3998]